MRVVIDARYIREKPSGIGAYVRALVDRLPALSPADEFTFWAHPLAPRPLSAAANVREVVVRPGPNSPRTIWWPRRFANFEGVDVFHAPHNLLPRGIPCATVVTVHDVMALERPELHLQGWERLWRSTYYHQAIWRALRQADRIIAPSQATADRIVALQPDARFRVRVTHEAPNECFRPTADGAAARAARIVGGDWPFLLVVGANVASKRHDLALAAFAAAVPAPWRLAMLQRRRQNARSEERVVWLEALAQNDVVTLLQTAGALVHPSVYEGFGLPVLEAMACGCPVVASDIPPLREVTNGAAVLVPPDDVDALAEALRQIVQAPRQRQELSEAGLARARDFSWDRCAQETLEIYREVAR